MRFYILDNGYLQTDKNNVVPGSNMVTRKHPHVSNQFYKLPIMCVLIEHEGRYILYDTGANMFAMKGHWPEHIQDTYDLHQDIEQNIEIQLAKCGVRAEQIDTVIISHMHFDHIGNLHLFQHADIYVPKADFMEAHTTVHVSDDPTTYGGYVKNDLDVTLSKVHLVEDEFEIIPGVKLLNLPGHTPALLGLMIQLPKEGTFIFSMDAIYINEIYGPPAKATGLIYNRIDFFNSIEKVRALTKKHHATMIPGHDWDIFQTLKKAPNYYE